MCVRDTGVNADDMMSKQDFKQKVEKRTNGGFKRNSQDVKDDKATWAWLEQGGMKRTTEISIFTAQD